MNQETVKNYLQQLENDGNSLEIPIKLNLEKEGYIRLKKLNDNNSSIVAAVYAGMTEKGKRVFSNED